MKQKEEAINKKTMKTIGEKRVRTDFNNSGKSIVDLFKTDTAKLIDGLETLKNSREVQSKSDPEQFRLIALAQTAYEEASMWAVKASTF